ncbi:MAG: transposase [Deltaproteobacteria bacterium]|nr:transposase [Deltaproteobacteria bacterium]
MLDGASSHRGKDLELPDNISLIYLPPYSPELNPTEQIWRILRKRYFSNKVFSTLNDAISQARKGLSVMARDKSSISALTNWPWISRILTAF